MSYGRLSSGKDKNGLLWILARGGKKEEWPFGDPGPRGRGRKKKGFLEILVLGGRKMAYLEIEVPGEEQKWPIRASPPP